MPDDTPSPRPFKTMKVLSTLLRFAAPLLLVLPAMSQTLTFRGQVEDVQGTNDFLVDCTNVQLSSSLFDLNLFVGQQTQITGNWNGSNTLPTVVVTAISVITESFGMGGNAKIGGDLRFDVTSTPGDITAIYGAEGFGFFPIGMLGAVQLDPTSVFLVALGTIPGGGNLEFEFTVPNDPTLVGMTFYSQAIVVSPSAPNFITNSDCKTISN